MTNSGYFAVGLGVGGVASFVVTYVIMRRKYEREMDTLVEDLKDEYGLRPNKVDKEEEKPKRDPYEDREVPLTKVRTSIGDRPVDIEKKQYHKMSAFYKKPDVEDISFDDDAPGEVTGSDDIRFISLDEYQVDEAYEKVTLFWYIGDDSLVDGMGDEVLDRTHLVGDLLETVDIPETPEPGLTLFIRSDDMHADYEIEMIDANFADPEA